MLYTIYSEYLDEALRPPPAQECSSHISFRRGIIILSLLIVVSSDVRSSTSCAASASARDPRPRASGPVAEERHATMGGVIILVAILVPMLFFGKTDNVYIQTAARVDGLARPDPAVWTTTSRFSATGRGAEGPFQDRGAGGPRRHRRNDHVALARHRRARERSHQPIPELII